jgi:2-polyprenyl-6-methoxyphenol hydroxylase-like FAD-dependent oxidoreductase
MMDEDTFRVIIIGAGPTGLALGNMLIAANIEFVILERHKSVITESGACIMLWPHAIRILDQLGLLNDPHRWNIPLHAKIAIDYRGSQISNDPTFQWIEEK